MAVWVLSKLTPPGGMAHANRGSYLGTAPPQFGPQKKNQFGPPSFYKFLQLDHPP